MKLQTNLKLAGDQPRAVQELISRFLSGVRINILLGATGTGKTFTIAIYPTASPDDYESNYLFLSISSHISGLESGSIVGLRKLLIRFGFEEVKESFFLKNHEIGKFSFVILEKGFLRIKITLRDNQTDYFLVLIDSSAWRVIEISRFDSESEKSSKNLNDLLILPMTDRVGVEKEDLRQTVGLIRKELKIQREKFIRDGRKEISDRINEIVKRDLSI